MAIDPTLLVMAPVLQDYLVDKDTGGPLSAGIITLYEDTNNHQTLKNWYYQTGTVGNYTFLPLPNPMTLSAIGTIVDPNGNDTLPFYYPYDENDQSIVEPYFIVVQNSNGELQFTRANFPYVPIATPSFNEVSTLNNLIANNVFYHNESPTIANSTNNTVNAILAPSQHDGFMAANFNDWRLIKTAPNTGGANDTVTFVKFPQNSNPFMNDAPSEYYLQFVGSGTTQPSSIRVPINLHIQTLENQPFTFTMQVQNDPTFGTSNVNLVVRIMQYLGTGGTPPVFVPIGTTGIIVATSTWTKVVIQSIFPSSVGITSTAGDDAFYLDISYPSGQSFGINIARPSIYLGKSAPTNDFKTYDQIDTIINSPRTGDVRTSINNFAPFGWVACNDGVISAASSAPVPITPPPGILTARANIDTWQLFNLLWNLNPVVSPMYNNLGVIAPTQRGASAYIDWNNSNQLQLTKTLGRVILGLPPLVAVTCVASAIPPPTWGATSPVAGIFALSFGNNDLLYVGTPVYLTGTMPTGGRFLANTIYYAIPPVSGNLTPPQDIQFQLADTYVNALLGNAKIDAAATDNGSNLVLHFALGGNIGQARHIQLEHELALHAHLPLAGRFVQAPGTTTMASGGAGASSATTAPTGLSYPFNIVQPSTYFNVFLKL